MSACSWGCSSSSTPLSGCSSSATWSSSSSSSPLFTSSKYFTPIACSGDGPPHCHREAQQLQAHLPEPARPFQASLCQGTSLCHDDLGDNDDGQVRDGGSLAGHHVGRHRWEAVRPQILQQVRHQIIFVSITKKGSHLKKSKCFSSLCCDR